MFTGAWHGGGRPIHPPAAGVWHFELGQHAMDHSDAAGARDHFQAAMRVEGAGRTAEARRLFQRVAGYYFNNASIALVRQDAVARTGRGAVDACRAGSGRGEGPLARREALRAVHRPVTRADHLLRMARISSSLSILLRPGMSFSLAMLYNSSRERAS